MGPGPGWYSRGYLPHFDDEGRIQFVTIRLHDSMPQSVLERYRLDMMEGLITEHERLEKMEAYLDAGHGACWLRDPKIATLVENAFIHGDGPRYRLLAWCVMPNHAHVMIEPCNGYKLRVILHSWKSFTALKANRYLGRQGAFWQREFFDRYIRSYEHFVGVRAYIENNPVAAGLVKNARDWPFSSLRYRNEEDW